MRRTTSVLALLLALLIPAWAPRAQEEPKEKIARVSFTQGDVSYLRGDDEEWNGLGVNTPLMTGDSLYASDDGRIELDVGNGNAVRMDTATALDLVNLKSEITQLGLSQGYLNVRVRDIPLDHTVEVATPLAAATLWEPGMYRVDVDRDTVRFGVVRGSLSVVLDGEQLDVNPGELLELQGGEEPSYGYGRLPQASAFDAWSEERDQRRQKSASSQYVHNAVMGYDDLDDSGSWRQDAAYGNVWYPTRVASDWAPYQSGNWVWQDPYGWTWVSYEPWGWAPYHYGRWVYTGNAWGWVPPPPPRYYGPAVVMNIRPVYAPALVAFIGGSNWGVGLSFGGGGGCMGWFPLAPADPYYYPWQHHAPVTHVTYNNIYINNSVTVVNYKNFGRGPVQRVVVGPEVIRRAPVLGGRAVGVLPVRASLAAYPQVKVPPRAIPVRAQGHGFVVRTVPPPKPVPFKTKLTEIHKTGKPYARPVTLEGDVGKPYRAGAKVPQGVKVKSALEPAAGGPKVPKLKPRQGTEVRPSKPVQTDVVRPKEKPAAVGGPDRPATRRGDLAKPDRPAKQTDPTPTAAPQGQPKADKPWKQREGSEAGPRPVNPRKPKGSAESGTSGNQGGPDKPAKPQGHPENPRSDDLGTGSQPPAAKPWKQKEGSESKPTRPENPRKAKPEQRSQDLTPGQAQTDKPKPSKPEQGWQHPEGKPEKPQKQSPERGWQPPENRAEKPKKQEPDRTSPGGFTPPPAQTERPTKQKEFKPQPPPTQGAENPRKHDGGQIKPPQVTPQPPPAQPQPEKKKKDKDKEKN